jgi:hypothetical protein
MKKEIFRKGDWARIGAGRPFQIQSTAIAKICQKMDYPRSSEEEQKSYDESYKTGKHLCHTKR